MRVFIIAAVTADGFIARYPGHPATWTSKEDKKHYVSLTKEAGVMVMGSRTFATIGRALPGRRTIVYTSRPESIDVEGVETTDEPPAALINRLRTEGAAGVAIAGGSQIYDLFMQAGLVKDLYLTVEPKFFGTGINLFNKKLDIDLSLDEIRQLNEHTLLLHYKVIKQVSV